MAAQGSVLPDPSGHNQTPHLPSHSGGIHRPWPVSVYFEGRLVFQGTIPSLNWAQALRDELENRPFPDYISTESLTFEVSGSDFNVVYLIKKVSNDDKTLWDYLSHFFSETQGASLRPSKKQK
eukprot:TRINITY_DN1296_c0_g1::TRINITY_DN1296_c0_g1_i1::g.26774::m.26774 TRINITY_DN1296_c0_g1::TRINITY_DN1296_c0_g1_i1::g.26774  ORF type:complete len:123 (-),score=9.85 TRINITY_DN1296_c0_g1_i1:112-480(-)